MSTNIEQNLQNILNEKNTYLLPGNLKSGVTCLGISGQYRGEVKLFETIQDMSEDTNPKKGDLALVYSNIDAPVTKESEFSSCRFPDTVVLPIAFTRRADCSFRPVEETGSLLEASASLQRSRFNFYMYSDSGEISVQYTSSDGITYTKREGVSKVDFGVTLKFEDYGEPFNENIGYFMRLGSAEFNGLYSYEDSPVDYIVEGVDTRGWNTDDFTSCRPQYIDISNFKQLYYELSSSSNTVAIHIMDGTYRMVDSTQVLTPTEMIISVFHYSSGGAFNSGITRYNNLNYATISGSTEVSTNGYLELFYYVNGVLQKTIELRSGSVTEIINGVTRTIENWKTYFTYLTTVNTSDKYLMSSKNMIAILGPKYSLEREIYSTTIDRGWQFISYHKTVSDGNFGVLQYILAKTQLDATSPYVYNKKFYGQLGVETGTLTTNISNSFADVNAEVYTLIRQQYESMQPRVLTDQDKSIDKNIFFIPVKEDGTVLLDTSNVTNMNSLFNGCKLLTKIPLIDTSNATSMYYTFGYCSSLTTIPLIDTSNVTTMEYLFAYCTSLSTIPLLDTSSVSNMNNLFNGCSSLTAIPLIDTSSVITMNSMFSGCSNLTTIPQLNTENVTSMNNMFNSCISLTSVPLLDTSKVTNIDAMFNGCRSLVSIPQFNTSKVTNFSMMFRYCSSLTTLPLLNSSSATNMYDMFGSCSNLSNDSLNNILSMCANASSYASTKTLKQIGLSSAQATTCQSLSNWSSATSAGWTTGY